MKEHFLLNQDYVYLNHGSFGACPKPVFEDYQRWQLELEKEPVEFITHTGLQQLEGSKKELAEFINCNPNDLVFTTNPSYALNIVARSLKLEPGDEILTTNLEYGAMDKTWKYYCNKSGARYVQQEIPLPLTSIEEMENAFWQGLTTKTKAIFISHITSATGLILPAERICRKAKELNLLTIVDGAHVPAHISLDLSRLNADIYTGACHKWMLTPKGCSFLYVKRSLQEDFDPLVISWGYDSDVPGPSKFIDYHQQQGTRDFSAFLTVPAALDFLNVNDWPHVSEKCRKLVRDNNHSVARILGTQLISPNNEEFIAQMCSIPVRTKSPVQLKKVLFHQYKIEIPVMQTTIGTFIRYSVQAYNTQNELDYLMNCLYEIVQKTDLIEI